MIKVYAIALKEIILVIPSTLAMVIIITPGGQNACPVIVITIVET